jgi:hypothetical protein
MQSKLSAGLDLAHLDTLGDQRRSPVAVGEKMIGMVSQAERGNPIKTRACAEFDRMAKAPEWGVGKQPDQKRMKTLSLIAILEEKWAVAMAKDYAGYFIHEWQE